MARDKFFFQDSARIYQQSEGVSDFLMETFISDPAPFRETANVLENQGASHIGDEHARRRAVDLAWKHLLSVSGALDTRSVVPGLLQAVEQYYYGRGSTKDQVPWLGTALKLAIAAVWGNLTSASASVKAYAQVRRLVAAAGACEQLILYSDQASAFLRGGATFRGEGTSLDLDADYIARNRWNEHSLRRGEGNRTLQACSQIIWSQTKPFMEAASEAAAGAVPSTIPLFQGTLFEAVEVNPDFWLGLLSRIQLMAHAAMFRQQGRDVHAGIAIFESFAVNSPYMGRDAAKANAASQAMFWQPDWYNRRLRGRELVSNMVVERPALRIDDHTFVTGVVTVGDSINCFVEHSVFRQLGYGGVPVSEEAFRRYLSSPFEQRVIACFDSAHWDVDHVSEKGLWCGRKLVHPTGDPVPGEVDVLARHRSKALAVLAECKVLTSPISSRKLLNVVQKLGAADGEGFHGKLARKAQWLRGTDAFNSVEILPLLLVDEAAFLAKDSPHPVLDIDLLTGFVKQVEAVN